jgi:hypothetical protein
MHRISVAFVTMWVVVPVLILTSSIIAAVVDLSAANPLLVLGTFYVVFVSGILLLFLHAPFYLARCPSCGEHYRFRNWRYTPSRLGCAHCGAKPPPTKEPNKTPQVTRD